VITVAVASGLVIGALGRLVVPHRQDLSLWQTLVVGVVAALAGGLVAGAIGAGSVVTVLIEVALAAIGVALVAGGPAAPRSR